MVTSVDSVVEDSIGSFYLLDSCMRCGASETEVLNNFSFSVKDSTRSDERKEERGSEISIQKVLM